MSVTLTLELSILLTALLLLLSIFTSKIAVRFGIPALILFLLIGMGLGSEGVGGIEFDYPKLTQAVGIVALIFILFSGGLHTKWDSVRPVITEGLLLSSFGVLITAIIIGIFAQISFGFTLEQGILLGATMASTDAAAVFSILSGKSIRLNGLLKPILELESGSNDPMAVFLTLGMIQLIIHPATSVIDLIPLFLMQMLIGGIIGVCGSYFMRYIINRISLEYDGLYPVLTISCVLALYGLATILNGNGFLAIYLGSILLAQRDFIHKNSLKNFHDGLAWLMQIAMFLVLGLQVFPSRLIEVGLEGILTAIVLILIARPLSIFLVSLPTQLKTDEKLFISWVGLRGATPIILATFIQLSDVKLPLPIFELVFFVVLVSIIFQGTTIIKLAKRLDLLSTTTSEVIQTQHIQINNAHLQDCLLQLRVAPTAPVVNKQILDIDLPENSLIVAINRASQIIIPRGSTIIRSDDELMILTDQKNHEHTTKLFT